MADFKITKSNLEAWAANLSVTLDNPIEKIPRFLALSQHGH
jgi:hypothetical protein